MFHNRRGMVMNDVAYIPGAQFRVIAPCRLNGHVPILHGASGWKQELVPGDIVTCTGFGPGMGSDPGYGIEWRTEKSDAEGAFHCDISPRAGSLFDFRPAEGLLEPL